MHTSRSLASGLAIALVAIACRWSARIEPTALADDVPAPAAAPDGGWPQVVQAGTDRLTIYEPTLDAWQGMRLQAHAAVAVETSASAVPIYGVVWLTARTAVHKDEGLVALEGVAVTRASFPSEPDLGTALLGIVRSRLSEGLGSVALDRLEASLAFVKAQEKAHGLELANDPPRVIFSDKPAILALLDGNPEFRRTEGTSLLRAINTRAVLLLDPSSGLYYLRVAKSWASARALDGPWSAASSPPAALDALGREADSSPETVTFAETPAGGGLPEIHVATGPAELIVTDGKMAFASIPGTELLYVTNTAADVFFETRLREYFALLSGRWFAAKPEGQWEHVPSSRLPAEFARIPETHPKAAVLASVAGTPQAQEAAIANTIPHTEAIDRKTAKLAVEFDGDPRFEAIAGTGLSYASNSSCPVIQAAPRRFLALENGVWFEATTCSGPWSVADTIPAEVYAIPPSCPIHEVTYVRVYDATPDVVYEGYTPGYLGTCLDADGIVVFGTGYRYRPWIHDRWFGRPWTYGFGACFEIGPHVGYSFGFGWGLEHGHSRPWWGPYRSFDRGAFETRNRASHGFEHANVYRAWGASVVARPDHCAPTRIGAEGEAHVYGGHDGHVYRVSGERSHAPTWERRVGTEWRRDQPSSSPRPDVRSGLEGAWHAHGVGETRIQGSHGGGTFRGGSSHGGGGHGR